MTRKEKALKQLGHLERIYDVYEAAKGDFVDVIGEQGGDIVRYRVHFKSDGEVDFVSIK